MVPGRLHALVVAAAAGVVLLTNLGGPALWDDDEPKNAACSLAMLDADDWVVPTFNGRLRIEKPPLVNWLQIAGYTMCGRNETGARIGSALLTVGSSLLTWRIGSMLLGPSVGLLSGLAMATCVWTAVAGRAATPDAPLLFCTTLALLIFVRQWRRQGAASGRLRLSFTAACGIGAACGFGMLAKGPVGFVIPVAAFTLFTCWQKAGRAEGPWWTAVTDLRLPAMLAAALVVAAPWYALVTWRTDGEWLRGFFLVHNVGRFAAPMEGHSGSLLYYPLTAAIGLFPWSIVLLAMLAHAVAILRSADDGRRTMPMRLLACWSIAWIGGFSCSGTKLPGYIWPAYPALAILTAQFLDDWARGDLLPMRWCRDPAITMEKVMRVAWGVLAIAGLALAVGLPVAALLHAPGAEWLGLIGLIPVVAAGWAWRCQSAGRKPHAIAVVACCSCAMVALLAAVGAERFSRPAGMRSFVAATDPRTGDESWACFWNVPPSLVFYARSTVAKLDTPADVARHLSGHPGARLLVDSRHEPLVADAIPAGCGVLARLPTLADHHYIVIGPDSSGSVPLAVNEQPTEASR